LGIPWHTKDAEIQVTGEYLTNYLKEMDGDDSQFKDKLEKLTGSWLSDNMSMSFQALQEVILIELLCWCSDRCKSNQRI